MFEILVNDALSAFPILGWAVVGLFVLLVQIITDNKRLCFFSAVVGLLCLLIYSLAEFNSSAQMMSLFYGSIVIDPLSQILNIVSILIALSVCLISYSGMESKTELLKSSYEQFPEYLICIIFSGFGAAVSVSAVDLTSFFLGIETLSIGLYCLCGFYRTEERSTESALKYLFVGAFSTVVLLYGIAFIYGASGSTNFDVISRTILVGDKPLVLLACLFTVAGLAFKLALVPFHFYTPDVYEGAPTAVTAYLASIVKVAVVGLGIRVFWGIFDGVSQFWEPFWLGLCVLSILVGNLAALQQRDLKKLFAFSSVSHAGFLGLGLLVAKPGVGDLYPVLAYLVIYCAMTVGVFGLISWVENREKAFLVEDLKGLGLKRPWVGFAFSVFALGMAGIPPLAGFMIKLWVFQALLEQGYLFVALLAIVGSVIGVAYYLKILMYLFMTKEGEEGAAFNWPGLLDRHYVLRAVIVAALLISLVGGLKPNFYADWILTAIALK